MRKRLAYQVILTNRFRLGAPVRGLGHGPTGLVRAVDHEAPMLAWTSREAAERAGRKYCDRWPRWRFTLMPVDFFKPGCVVVAPFGSKARRRARAASPQEA